MAKIVEGHHAGKLGKLAKEKKNQQNRRNLLIILLPQETSRTT